MKKDNKNKKEKSVLSPFINEINPNFLSDNETIRNDYYYDAMDYLGSGKIGAKKALKLLELALKMDEDYVQTYIGLISTYGVLGDKPRVNEMTKIAYQKTQKKFPKWPEEMSWGYLENRAYLRAIQFMAELYWDNNEEDKAIKLFRLLLKLNPNDNQGARYEIAGLYAGLKGDDINKMFDDGNKNQNWDLLRELVEDQNKKHKFWVQSEY